MMPRAALRLAGVSLDTYHSLGLTVRASPRKVVRATRRLLPADWLHAAQLRAVRKAFYRDMLCYHRAAQRLAREFRW
jgi:hypothetical protein